MRLPIRVVLAFCFLFASALPLAVFWLWPHSSALDNKVAEVHERHLLLARNLGAAMQTYHQNLLATFDAFAGEIAAGRGGVARGLFENLHFRHVCVADRATGAVLNSFLTDTAPCPLKVPETLRDMFYFMSAADGVQMSGVMTPGGGAPRIYLVKRLDDQIVIGAIRTDFFLKIQRAISFGRLGHAAIVDQHGRVLAHPLESWEKEAKDITVVSAVQRMLAGESGVETFFSPALKGDMIAGFTAVDGPGWGVMVPQPVVELEEAADQITRDAIIVFAIGLALSAAIALAMSGRIANRLKQVEAASGRMAKGEQNVRIDGTDSALSIRELSNLRKGFNAMSEQLETARAELIAQSYKSGHADMAASTLHNLRNAMNPLINRVVDAQTLLAHAPGTKMPVALDELSDVQTAPDRREKLMRYCVMSAAEIETWRARVAQTLQVTNDQFARIKEMLIAEEQYANAPPVIADIPLKTLVEEALNLVPIDRRAAVTVTLDPSLDRCPMVQASRLLLLQVLQNLITNAAEAIDAAPDTSRREIVIAAEVEDQDDDASAAAHTPRCVRVTVSDSGVGIEADKIEAIFRAGFTTKSDGPGGLGLHWCANTMKRMHGHVFAESEGPGNGARLTLILPVAA
ncbi:MAG: ATP-binding protein [Pseudomonadota bacterium]